MKLRIILRGGLIDAIYTDSVVEFTDVDWFDVDEMEELPATTFSDDRRAEIAKIHEEIKTMHRII